jgi:hypothetical protein
MFKQNIVDNAWELISKVLDYDENKCWILDSFYMGAHHIRRLEKFLIFIQDNSLNLE